VENKIIGYLLSSEIWGYYIHKFHYFDGNNFIHSLFWITEIFFEKKWHVLPNEVQSQPYSRCVTVEREGVEI